MYMHYPLETLEQGKHSDFLSCHVLQVGTCLDLKGYGFSSSHAFPFQGQVEGSKSSKFH
jgi:hypothetical protein